MTLHVPPETTLRFSVLDFPYAQAIKAFMDSFAAIYEHQHDEPLPFSLRPPYRQLNDALLTLAPGLIQGFEGARDGDEASRRMVAFTRFEDGHTEDFPTLQQLSTLIRFWLERWAQQPDVKAIVQGDGKARWQTLLNALKGSPETDWQHGINPASLAADPGQQGALGYLVLPALLTALLHDQTMTIQRWQGNRTIIWRRANDGGKNGLHLVSQPIPYKDDYFAYRLDFTVQTQAGHAGSWIFARLSIQRYIGKRYRSGDDKRAISILVGHNRERFSGGWDADTTLIRLPVQQKGQSWNWVSDVGSLLDDYAVRRLERSETILNAPQHFDGQSVEPDGDEYYVVYAEGRKFSDKNEGGRAHHVKTGVTLREQSQIMAGVIALLDGWLEKSTPFQRDTQNPASTFALRDYDYMVDAKRRDNTAQKASWRAALETSLTNSDFTQAQLVVLYRSPEFRQWAQAQINQALLGADQGNTPLVTVIFEPLPPLLYAPLDSGDLDPQACFLPHDQKPEGWTWPQWNKRMREGYVKKRAEWREFLSGLNWQPNARRLLLIDSTGEAGLPDNQKIKGAVRDACHRENISSQFIIGSNLKLDKKKAEGSLDGGSAGKLKNAVLDLIVRQQGILYAPPREIYERAACLDAETASRLDIIAFCRVQRKKSPKFCYVLAVRLQASGEVDVMLPGDATRWIPYDIVSHVLGTMYSEARVSLANDKSPSLLRLGHKQMLNFAHEVLTKRLERPTLAVIEAAGWRDRGAKGDDCWTQLTNPGLSKSRDVLKFDNQRVYERNAPMVDQLLGVIRLRMDDETPQYVLPEGWDARGLMSDIPHLTGYVDLITSELLHYFSVARLPEMQKKQKDKHIAEAFRWDVRTNPLHDMAVKHPQLVEMVPFFVHPRYQSDEGQRQLCRCVHCLRNSPAFTMGEIVLPYPMHLGEKLIRDQLVIIGADD